MDLLVASGLRGLAFYGLLEKAACTLRVPADLIDVQQLYGLRNRIGIPQPQRDLQAAVEKSDIEKP